MIDIKETVEKLQDFLEENRQKSLIVCGLLLFICLLALLGIAKGSSKSKKTEAEQKFVLEHELLVPAGPEIPDGYVTTRKTEKVWSEEEIQKWFTLPDETEVQKLADSNDRIVQDIIGAAP